jgi:hypothetical protein
VPGFGVAEQISKESMWSYSHGETFSNYHTINLAFS